MIDAFNLKEMALGHEIKLTWLHFQYYGWLQNLRYYSLLSYLLSSSKQFLVKQYPGNLIHLHHSLTTNGELL